MPLRSSDRRRRRSRSSRPARSFPRRTGVDSRGNAHADARVGDVGAILETFVCHAGLGVSAVDAAMLVDPRRSVGIDGRIESSPVVRDWAAGFRGGRRMRCGSPGRPGARAVQSRKLRRHAPRHPAPGSLARCQTSIGAARSGRDPAMPVCERAIPTSPAARQLTEIDPTERGGVLRARTSRPSSATRRIVPVVVPVSARNERTILTAEAFSSGEYRRL
jgi:hypothetical protein